MHRTLSLARSVVLVTIACAASVPGCARPRPAEPVVQMPTPVERDLTPRRPIVGEVSPRAGDEIMVAGRLVHTGAPVVLWLDPPNYDAYRVTKRFAPPEQGSWEASAGSLDTPNRYGDRPGMPEGGWTLTSLAGVVDQFVLHYDATGLSRTTFKVLHDVRGLSVHFMIDLDGTIYQTLDVKERAWHATIANDRSIGVEIANIGAYPPGDGTLADWYAPDAQGPRVTLPAPLGDGGIRDNAAPMRPSRVTPVTGVINGDTLTQYDFTDAQYESLAKLSAALCTVLPRIRPDVPRDATGRVITKKLTDEAFGRFSGILGHYHVQANKADPGPAFDWDRLVRQTRAFMGAAPTSEPRTSNAGG